MIIAIIILVLSIITFLLLCFVFWMLKHQLSTKEEILDYLFKKYGICWKSIIKNNKGCYIIDPQEHCYIWYSYYKPYLCRDYVLIKLKRKYKRLMKINVFKGDKI